MTKRSSLTSVIALFSVCLLASLPVSVRADDSDTRAVPLKTPPPRYPEQMRSDGISGLVTVKVSIDPSGNVAECTVSKSSRAEFEQAALSAIKTWKFRPASKDGQPVASQLIIPIKFSLADS
jgi:protein TonB